MNFENLFESTQLYTPKHQVLNFEDSVSGDPNLMDVLEIAKNCILAGKEYDILTHSGYNPNKIVPRLITASNKEYRLRKNPCILEHNLTPFSSFLIFHIANMRVNSIITEFTNPDCLYSCYLYLSTDTNMSQAVIVLNDSENSTKKLKNIITHIHTDECDIDSDEDILGINNLNDVLTLCACSAKGKPRPENPMSISDFTSHEQNLMLNECVIDYSPKGYQDIYEKSLKKAVFETIKNFKEPFLITRQATKNSNLYTEMHDLLSLFAAKEMTVILGYYLYSMQYFSRDDQCHDWFSICDYQSVANKKPFTLHILYSRANEIVSIFKKLNRLFYGEKLFSYTYLNKKSQKPDIKQNSPICIICESDTKQLCSKKWFNRITQNSPTIVISSASNGEITTEHLSHKITKITSLAAATTSHKYQVLPDAIFDFYKWLHIKTTTFSSCLESKKISCHEDTFIQKLFKEYREVASAQTTYYEDETGKKLTTLFFFVYSFLKFCLQEQLITLEQANALNKKLFEFYFKDKVMWFEDNSQTTDDTPSESDVADAIIKLLRNKYKSIPHHHPNEGTPCIFVTKDVSRLIFPSKNFLNEFTDWVKREFPEEAPTIELIRKYISKKENPHNDIREYLFEKKCLSVTQNHKLYKLDNSSYVAFKNDVWENKND